MRYISQIYDAFALGNEISLIQLRCIWYVVKAWLEELQKRVSLIEIQIEV